MDRLKHFDWAFENLLESEGGFVSDPDDRGGPTKYGITQRTLDDFWLGLFDEWNYSGTCPSVTAIKPYGAKLIYLNQYWLPYRCGELPELLQYYYFDCCVNHGPYNAAVILQKALNWFSRGNPQLKVDGIVGPATIDCSKLRNAQKCLRYMKSFRENFMKEITTYDHSQKKFLDGWLNRANSVYQKSLEKFGGEA